MPVLPEVCSISGCDRGLYSRKLDADGLCRRHHMSLRKYGDPLVGFERAFDERVDRGSVGECWKWTGGVIPAGEYGDYGYFHGQYAHRIAFERAHGPIPTGLEVDHACHNRICVNPAHLRLATGKQNKEHRQGAQRNSRCGVRGVIKRGDKFVARVRHHGKDIWVGTYSTPAQAGEAARLRRIELFTHNDLDRQLV